MKSCSPRLRWCGAYPYVPSKRFGLEKRGLLRPDVWAAVHVLATDADATVNRVCFEGDSRIEVISTGITIVVVDFEGSGFPVVLTAYVAGDPVYPAGSILTAAGVIDLRRTVDLDDRMRGRT